MPEHFEDVCLDVGPLEGRVLALEFHDEVVAEHLLEVGLVVVHDGEVFLVEVQPGQVERMVGEPQPETVICINLVATKGFVFAHSKLMEMPCTQKQ